MKLEILNPIDCSQWDDLVLDTNGYSFFHSSAWAEVLRRSYGYRPSYFTMRKEGKLQALIPIMEVKSFLTGKRGVSLTFADYCEPICKDQESFHVLLKHIIDYGRKWGWKYFELRGGQNFLPDAPASESYLGHTLELTDNEQNLLSRFRESTRRNIKKAVQEGVETQICTTLQGVTEFYKLHCMTRKRHRLPPQPFHFFRNIYDRIIAKDRGFVILASYQEKTIAGSVFFHFGNRALYKFGASDESYQRLRASNLVMWEAIKWYALKGYAAFCFGRTEQDNLGLIQFKNGWGTTEKNIYYYKYDLVQDKFVGKEPGKRAVWKSLLQKIPNPILKRIGSILYKHIG